MLKVLVTGATGLVGNIVYARLAAQPERYDVYASARRARPSARAETMAYTDIPSERLRLADLTDFDAMRRAVEGMDVVVHMAAEPNVDAPWENVLHSNIIGSYHLFEASRLAGVKRVIYASTNMVVFGYLRDEPYRSSLMHSPEHITPQDFPPVRHDQPPWPTSLYACSKIFGESLARMYATLHNLSCICLRIGWVTADDQLPTPWARLLWCSQRDIAQLVERCINAPDSLRFDIFFGQSNNRYNLVDIQHARDVLGYAPQDSAEDRLAQKRRA
ncbi:MAG: NAD(P)-dependent oxidoreductase [Anaerolineae bacterium]|nr:NAD(P)-dependent oxidoreductase [Thermoflexales bacterium]MDW8406378.1 NAD(P)-dependent oxidoreductase [Anaerolineae bacterium]